MVMATAVAPSANSLLGWPIHCAIASVQAWLPNFRNIYGSIEVMKSLEALRAFLKSLAPGVLSDDDAGHAEGLLEASWGHLDGSSNGGMKREKLSGRTEQMRWDPPELSFVIERHGAIVGGDSSRAELQHWGVDIDSGTARFGSGGYRRIRPNDARLDVTAVASKVAKHIREQRSAPFLQWRSDTEVCVIVGTLITANNRQTLAGRRKRFRVALDEQIAPIGWRQKGSGTHLVYQRASS